LQYISTRGAAPALDFTGVLLSGLARDGGLYVPETWPFFDKDRLKNLVGRDYANLALAVMAPFIGDALPQNRLKAIIHDAYAQFRHRAVAPLVQVDAATWLMELFHGPTLAFKDVALQLVGRLYDEILGQTKKRIAIVGATSGDTGSAALEACRDRAAIDVFMLYPNGRVSEIQRRQMTTIDAPNVFNVAIDGTFDDCQDLLKALFNDHAFRDRIGMSAVNSINWARVMAQIVYYFAAALALGAPGRAVSFAVPSGNFGNIYAAYAARRMGLPVRQLIVGSNRNDILARFFKSGVMEIGAVHPTLSPSMDIQVSSNVERLLFDLYGRDGARLAADMATFRKSGRLALPLSAFAQADAPFSSFALDDAGTLATMADFYRETGQIIDTHSAIGLAAARACRDGHDVPVVALATAHPAKFPDAVKRAIGISPALPPHLADLFARPERFDVLPNDAAVLKTFILDKLASGATGR